MYILNWFFIDFWSNLVPIWVQFGSNLGPKIGSKLIKNRCQVDVKLICLLTSILDTFLVGFWKYFGTPDTPKTLKNQWFFKVFAKFAWCSSAPSWTPLGPQIGTNFGAKLGAKCVQNRWQNRSQNVDNFDTHFWRPSWPKKLILGPNLVFYRPQVGAWN